MKRGAIACLMVCVLLVASSVAFGAKIRVAVIEFENKSEWHWIEGGAPGEMLVTMLVNDGRFSCIEREKLDLILQEQNLGQSGAVTTQTAAKIGKLLGVNYIITGAVSEWGETDRGGHLGSTNVGVKTYTATVDVRAVNVDTGEIMAAVKAEGKDRGFSGGTRIGRNVGGRLLGGRHVGGGEGYSEKRASETLRDAVENAGAQLIEQLSGGAPGTPGADLPKVADVDGKSVVINQGSNAGIAVDQIYDVMAPGKEIIDPDTGQTLSRKEKKVGAVKITSVDANMSEGEIIEGSGIAAGNYLKVR